MADAIFCYIHLTGCCSRSFNEVWGFSPQ